MSRNPQVSVQAAGDQGAALLQKYPEGTPLKMVLLVRKDLKMQKGKIAAQCSHATLACYKVSRKYQRELLKEWEWLGQAKITLTVTSDVSAPLTAAILKTTVSLLHWVRPT
jgi:hypothetical protein